VVSAGGDVTLNAVGNLFLGDTSSGADGDVNTDGAGNVTLQAGGNINVDEETFVEALGTGNISVTAGGNISLLQTHSGGAQVDTAGGTITFQTGPGGVFTSDAGNPPNIFSTGGDITVNADDMVINDPIDAGSATITLRQAGTTARPITLGGGASGLGISDDELGHLTAGLVRIGRTNNAGDITVDGAVVAHAGFSTLSLLTGGAINNLGGSITVANLALQASTGIGDNNSSGSINLVSNGGFETGDFTGWTQGGNTGFTSVSGSSVHSGSFAADLGPVGSDGTLSQNIVTTPGQQYVLSFWLESDGSTPNDFSASVGGTTVFSVTDDPAHGYVQHSFTFTATGASTQIQFAFRNDNGFLNLDDVSVAGVVPAVLPGLVVANATPGTPLNVAFVNSTSGRVQISDVGGARIAPVDTITTTSSTVGGGFVSAASPLTIAMNTTVGGPFTFTAGNSAAAGDNLTINNGVSVTMTSAVSSTLTFNAGDNIAFLGTAHVLTNGGGTHTVALNADTEGNGTGTVTQSLASTVSVVTNNLSITGLGGIGTSTALRFRFNTDTLNTSSTNTNQFLQEEDDVALQTMTAGNGNIDLNAPNGNIFDDGNNATRVSAHLLTLRAVRAIGAPGATGMIDTAATSLDAATTGAGPFSGAPTPGIWVTDLDDLAVSSALTTGDGVILIDAGGNLNAQSVIANGTGRNIRLRALGGNLTAGVITAAGDVVSLSATGAILDGNGAANNVTALSLLLAAGTGIASAADPLETTVSNLAWSSGTGSIDLANSGALTVTSVTAFGATVTGGSGFGHASITASSPLTVASDIIMAGDINLTTVEGAEPPQLPAPDDDLTVNGGVTVRSNGGNVNFTSGDSVLIQAGATVRSDVAATGTVSLLAGVGDTDNDAVLTVNGTISAANIVLQVPGDFVLPSLTASNSISVTSTGGNILDDADETTWLSAPTINLTAALNIGGRPTNSGANTNPITFDPTANGGLGNFTDLQNAIDVVNVTTLNLNQTGAGGNVQIRQASGPLSSSALHFASLDGAVGAGRQIALIAAGGQVPATLPGDLTWNGVFLGGVLSTSLSSTNDNVLLATTEDVAFLAPGPYELAGGVTNVTGTAATPDALRISSALATAATRTVTGAAASPLVVSADISSGGDVLLSSTGDLAGDGVTISAQVVSTGGSITVTADRDVTLTASGSLLTSGTNAITLSADLNGNAIGKATLNGSITSTDGNVSVSGHGVSQGPAGDIESGAGSIVITAGGGAISLAGTIGGGATSIDDASSVTLSGTLLVQALSIGAGTQDLADFQGPSLDGFSATGLWHVTATNGGGLPGHTVPDFAYYGIDAQGNYDTGGTNSGDLTSGPIALLAGGSASLSFNYRLQTEGFVPFDKADVQISTDGGVTFTTVASNTGAQDGGVNLPDTLVWSAFTVDLSAFAGQNIVVRFHFDSVDAGFNDFLGWQVDDVSITGGAATITGNVNQTGGSITVAGNTSVRAGGTVTLNQPSNDFNTVSATVGNGLTLQDVNDVTLSSVTAAAGNVTVTAGGNILVDSVTAPGTIKLTAGGAIEEVSPGDPAADLVAASLMLSAGSGIGAAGQIEIDTNTLTAAVSGAGAINLRDLAGGLTVSSATTSNGGITLDAVAGALNLIAVNAGGTLDLTTLTSGTINLGNVIAADTATLTSAGAIEELGNDAAADLSAPTLILSAAAGSIGGLGAIEIDATTLQNASATSAGSVINLSDVAGGLAVTSATASGNVTLNATGGDLVATSVTSTGGDLSLSTTASGNLTLGTVTAATLVRLSAAGAINGSGAGTNVTATNLAVHSATGFGAATVVTSAVANFAANVGPGGVHLDNSGPLTITSVDGVAGISSGGAVDVSAASPLDVAADVTAASGNITLDAQETAAPGDDLTVEPGVTVHAGAGNVTLRAGDNLTLPAGSAVTASGAVLLEGDFNDADGSGSVITIDGLTSGATVTALGGPNADSFEVSLTGASGITLDGQGSGDTYTINLGSLSGPVRVLDTGATGTDSATVNGTAAAESFTVGPTGLTSGSQAVQYDANLEQLTVNGNAGSDTFDVTPGASTTLFINGDDPPPPASPGDLLHLELAGTVNPTLFATFDPANGFFGHWSFAGLADVNFTTIETLTPSVTISGRTANDLNGDGNIAADPGQGGVTIQLIKDANNNGLNDDPVVATQTTVAGTGAYSFANLGPGRYFVQEVTPAGSVRTAGPAFYTVVAQSGTDVANRDFGIATIAAFKSAKLSTNFPIGLGNGSIVSANLRTNSVNPGSLQAPFPGFSGEVHSAGGVLPNGDVLWVFGAGAGGGPAVQVVDGTTGQVLAQFFAYPANFTGGVFVAVGDVNGDGVPDIITGAGPGGGPQVEVIDGSKLGQVQANGQIDPSALLASFFAYSPSFAGGVTVAARDVNGDGHVDIVTGAGPGGGPAVKVIDGTQLGQVQGNGQIADGALLASFFAYEATFSGGVFVAVGDVDGDGHAEVITGPGAGHSSLVEVFNGANLPQVQGSFNAYPATFTGGVRVGAVDVSGNGLADIITGAGPGGGPAVEVFDGQSLSLIDSFFATNPKFTAGVFV
jgi:hypothetical protein